MFSAPLRQVVRPLPLKLSAADHPRWSYTQARLVRRVPCYVATVDGAAEHDAYQQQGRPAKHCPAHNACDLTSFNANVNEVHVW